MDKSCRRVAPAPQATTCHEDFLRTARLRPWSGVAETPPTAAARKSSRSLRTFFFCARIPGPKCRGGRIARELSRPYKLAQRLAGRSKRRAKIALLLVAGVAEQRARGSRPGRVPPAAKDDAPALRATRLALPRVDVQQRCSRPKGELEAVALAVGAQNLQRRAFLCAGQQIEDLGPQGVARVTGQLTLNPKLKARDDLPLA